MTVTTDAAAVPASPSSDVASPPRPGWWRRRRRWVALAATACLAGGGLTAFLVVRAHYVDAQPLSCACGLVWSDPDRTQSKDEQVGPWSASVVPARPGHVQAFEVMIINRSSVTQTVVGTEHDDGQTAEPVDVTFARPTGSVLADQGEKSAGDFTDKTARLAPGGARWVRYAIHTAGGGLWSQGREESFTSMEFTVKVGAWTRHESVDFGDFAFVLSSE